MKYPPPLVFQITMGFRFYSIGGVTLLLMSMTAWGQTDGTPVAAFAIVPTAPAQSAVIDTSTFDVSVYDPQPDVVPLSPDPAPEHWEVKYNNTTEVALWEMKQTVHSIRAADAKIRANLDEITTAEADFRANFNEFAAAYNPVLLKRELLRQMMNMKISEIDRTWSMESIRQMSNALRKVSEITREMDVAVLNMREQNRQGEILLRRLHAERNSTETNREEESEETTSAGSTQEVATAENDAP